MDLSRSLLAPVAIQDRKNNVVSVDLAAFLTRLLLFDTYILRSIWLEDLILLQHSFGAAGLAQLLESGALKVECPVFTFGQTGQMRYSERSSRPPLPLFNYEFSVIRVQGAEEKLQQTLGTFDPALRSELVKGRVLLPEGYAKTVFQAWYKDLLSDLVDSAVRIQLRRLGIVPVHHHVEVMQKGEDEFTVENDLPRRYRLPDIEAHRIIDSAMMALGRIHDQVGSMQAYSALAPLAEIDKGLLDAKLGAIARLVNPQSNEKAFCRVVALKGLPVPQYGSAVVDVKKLLRLRQSDECRAFKDWLSSSRALSDNEVRQRVSGFGRSVRQALHSTTGKAVRFVVSNGFAIGLGLVSLPLGIVGGVAVSAVDSFLLERVMPKDSIISFLTEGYPSLYKMPGKT